MWFFKKKGDEEKTAEPKKTLNNAKVSQETESQPSTLAKLRSMLDERPYPSYVREAVLRELEHLQHMDPGMSEYSIGLNYVEYLLKLPWNKYTQDNLDFSAVEQTLNKHHYGLTHIKERILEYLAIRTLCILRNFRILVVDDEEIALRNLDYILKREGYDVDTATNGREALEKVIHKDFDLVITDLKMDQMDGMQLLEKIKEVKPQVEVAVVTGYATVDSAVEALKKGAVHYISKPINIEDLKRLAHEREQKKRHQQIGRGAVLCFVGPPGTGKTSMGKSIAEALGRSFARISLGGLKDEAELRGHRRTYVGALPGRIIQEIYRLGVSNPVIMLDEVDKIGKDFRGDPASVLLEILDQEQNFQFYDHYLEIPFDLSRVMFIATANTVSELPGPLIDRFEVIQFSGYTEREKIQIAKNYILPKLQQESGLSSYITFDLPPEVLAFIIREYTREAGLRNLERELAALCRRVAMLIVSKKIAPCDEKGERCAISFDIEKIQEFLGPPRFQHEKMGTTNRIGVTTGLVWTENGGEILLIESTKMQGTNQLILTGLLGKILKESAHTALSYLRSNAEHFGIDPMSFSNVDIHIHIPSGAIPKDGPSAGITIFFALLSLFLDRPARRNVALTGELTLTGRILPVEGIREKLLAAQRAGITTVILPAKNLSHVEFLSEDVKEGLQIVLVDDVSKVIDIVLE